MALRRIYSLQFQHIRAIVGNFKTICNAHTVQMVHFFANLRGDMPSTWNQTFSFFF